MSIINICYRNQNEKKETPRLTMECMTFPWSVGAQGEKTYKLYGFFKTTTAPRTTRSTTADPIIEKLLDIFH